MPHDCQRLGCRVPAWMRFTLLAAGVYNLAFAFWTLQWPHAWFDISGIPRARYVEIWQGLGMVVGVFGIGYLIAAFNPFRHWPIVLLGLLGKVFGPIGFAQGASHGDLYWRSGWLLFLNDLIWWIPFTLILWQVLRSRFIHPPTREEPYTPAEAAALYHLSTGESLLEASRDKTVALVFLRHFGCTFTRQILKSLQQLRADANANGARLVLVHMLQKGEESGYLAGKEDVARIADPRCELYRAFGLGKATFLELFGPKVWLRGIMALFKGCGVGLIAGDGLQMPGAFLIRDGEIISAHPAERASDLPDLPALFAERPAAA